MDYPKITIKFNKFLDPIFKEWILSQPKFKDIRIPRHSTVLKNIKMYQKEWDKYGDKILKGIVKATGMPFKRNEIDVYVVTFNPRSFSRPIVVKSRYSKMKIINVLAHELIHANYSDNKVAETTERNMYKHKNKIVESHVILDAVLKYIYLDVLKEPERLKVDIKSCSNSKFGYDIAWEIVEKEDYKKLIRKLNPKFEA